MEISTLEFLNQQDWALITKRMVVYAEYQKMKKHWNTNDNDMPKGQTAKSLVHEAIIKVYTGVRIWDKQKDPDLLHFLCSNVLRSMIWNLSVSHENKLNNPTLVRVGDDESLLEDPVTIVETYADTDNFENEIYAEELLSTIKSKLSKDPDGLLVLLEMLKGKQNIAIAEDLGISKRDVENIKKRIRSAIKEIPAAQTYLKGTG